MPSREKETMITASRVGRSLICLLLKGKRFSRRSKFLVLNSSIKALCRQKTVFDIDNFLDSTIETDRENSLQKSSWQLESQDTNALGITGH